MTLSRNSAHDTIASFSFNPQLSSLACDHWHHYYHYRASAQYLWLAETLCALGHAPEALAAYDKAIFQDHLNEEGIEGKKSVVRGACHVGRVPAYDKHPLSDLAFCTSVGKQANEATALHDEGIRLLLAGDAVQALTCFDRGIAADAGHSNSYFARGKYWFREQQYEKAREDFEEAVRLSHLQHEAYHCFASAEHLARALKFFAEGEFDLAITSCTKALDLYRKNKEAFKTRAKAYRAKGNVKQAEEDEKSTLLL